MRRLLSCWRPGSYVLATLLTCGCQHDRCCCSKRPTAPLAALTAPFASAARSALAVDTPVLSPAAAKPQADPTPAPAVHTAAEHDANGVEQGQAPTPSLTATDTNGQASVAESFGHDPNYRWLVGTLDYSRIQEAWLLRYVPFEEDDRYGGCVTLVGFVPPPALKPGQRVRVEGSLVDPNSRQLRPAFQVQNFRVLGL
jgi:hypothetical protein